MPDTFDVDRAFEALAHDVMDRAAPPSAVAAIKQARRRRRTAIATAALAAAVVVGGVALPTLTGDDDSSGLVATEGLRELPGPAAFAPEGWGPVRDIDPEVTATNACLSSFLMQSASPLQPVASGQALLARGDDWLLGMFADFGDDATSATEAVSIATDPTNKCGSPDPAVRYTHGEVQHSAIRAAGQATDVWTARLGNRVGFAVRIGQVASAADETTGTGDSLMAALQHPDTWQLESESLPVPSSSESQATFGAEVNEAAIDEAFGDWFPDWRQARVDGGLPCASLAASPDAPQAATGSGSMPGSGGVTLFSYQWATDATATAAREALLSDLRACSSAQWSIENSGELAGVATSDAGGLWITQAGDAVGLFEAREGVDPPADVKARVTTLLADLR